MFLKRFIGGLDQTGDTIIEVMIVLAVLGLALSISYATANRSLLDTRQAEENAQAARYLQSEIETLYNWANSCNAIKPGKTGSNCNSFTPYPSHDNYGGTSATDPPDIYSWYKPFCSASADNLLLPAFNSPPNDCTNWKGLYQLAVYYCDNYPAGDLPTTPCPNPPAGTDTFVAQITWPDVEGEGTDSITQAYRIHPGEGSN